MAASLAACGSDDGLEDEAEEVSVTTAEAEGEPEGELVISNWPFYIDKQTIPDFEQETVTSSTSRTSTATTSSSGS